MELRPEQESALSQMQKSRKQDLRIPLLINIHDGRLMPNVPNVASNPDYRPYRGKADASPEERMAYVASIVSTRRVINSAAEEAESEPVDIGKMEKTELIAFAYDEYGLVLDPATDVRTLRKEVMKSIEVGIAKKAPADDMSE